MLYSVIALIILPIAGLVIGAALGMIFAAAYVKLPGKRFLLKGIMLSIMCWSVFVLLVLLMYLGRQRPLLEGISAGFLWSPLPIIYGALHGIFWKKLTEPTKETFLRRIIFRRLAPKRMAYIIIILIVTIIVLSAILAPIAKIIF